ncbi:MAG: alkyl sulfatase BDS1-like metallo-beta-lactamase superfamily hydrolase [Myxococcota bacterium]|jgi:alkyl sulfatase BDS1-like metallo-beta-lactamase superfamily hydrolase
MTHRYSFLLGFLVLVLNGCADDPAADPTGADVAADDVASPDSNDIIDVADAPNQPDSDQNASGLAAHCHEAIGEARVEKLADGLYVAIGFDLANTILIQTSAGNVIVDVSMSPVRAAAVKEALLAVAPGPTLAVVYTHSHIDHVGGASVWVEDGTEVWATEPFMEHFLKQYGGFRKAETIRGRRQFGQNVGQEEQPCSAIGRTPDVAAALSTGFVQPSHTFTGTQTLTFGGVDIELVEAHGETHDQLFVWLPSAEALLPGDNFYAAFPNLYTIRGTSARPVDEWIRSLDAMRRFDPAILVPSHTRPLLGREVIRPALRDYRDAIAWLVAEVTRRANTLESLPSITKSVSLPPHLADSPWLAERYGQVDWSVKAIYQTELGWFDGRADTLYPPADVTMREIEMMGGAQKVLAAAKTALDAGDARWATHLLGKLRDSGLVDEATLAPGLAAAYRAVANDVINTNGRGYLLERAWELDGGVPETTEIVVGSGLVSAIPPSLVFGLLPIRLIADQALDVHETVAIELIDTNVTWYITVRFGVAQVVAGELLPDTPAPVATIRTSAETWVGLTLQVVEPLEALADGSLEIDDTLAALSFLARFEQGI